MFSPKIIHIYQILLKASDSVRAKQLADQLHIFPSTVYRLTQPLEEMGLIEKSRTRPYTFTAKSLDESRSLYLLHQNDWFMHQFFPTDRKNTSKTEEIPELHQIRLSFIQSREELMHQSALEAAKAQTSIDLLRSGHEIPADVMLAILDAKKRGVITRMLIQDHSPENANQVAYWQKNGIQVRKTELKHIRLMLFDARVVYFMSYKHTDTEKDLGMNIVYPPFATILAQLFGEWWEMAMEIQS